jgi:hypothetical protein
MRIWTRLLGMAVGSSITKGVELLNIFFVLGVDNSSLQLLLIGESSAFVVFGPDGVQLLLLATGTRKV